MLNFHPELSETGHASIFSAMLLQAYFFLVEMLPYLSSPVYSMFFYFIEGRVGYLPFKKMNRKF